MDGGIEGGPKPIAAMALMDFAGAWMILAAIFGSLAPKWLCVGGGVALGLASVLLFANPAWKWLWGLVALGASLAVLIGVWNAGGLTGDVLPGLVGVAGSAVAFGWPARGQ